MEVRGSDIPLQARDAHRDCYKATWGPRVEPNRPHPDGGQWERLKTVWLEIGDDLTDKYRGVGNLDDPF